MSQPSGILSFRQILDGSEAMSKQLEMTSYITSMSRLHQKHLPRSYRKANSTQRELHGKPVVLRCAKFYVFNGVI